MGEGKRRRLAMEAAGHRWPEGPPRGGVIELHRLPAVAASRCRVVREMNAALGAGERIADDRPISVEAYRAVVGGRRFLVGFCLGEEDRFSSAGLDVIDRLYEQAEGRPRLHVVPVLHRDIAWDVVLRHLRAFRGEVLLFSFPDPVTYDAGTAEKHYSRDVVVFMDGRRQARLDERTRRRVRQDAMAIYGEPDLPVFHAAPGVDLEEEPWIFEMRAGEKALRLAVWNGRRDYAHLVPPEAAELVGGERIAVVQVDSPVGVEGRSSVALSEALAGTFDGVVHWARDTETYASIVRDLVLADLPTVSPPVLAEGWKPEVVILAARGP
jgi:hypothetical protein